MTNGTNDVNIIRKMEFGSYNSNPYTLHCLVTADCNMKCPGCAYTYDRGEVEWDWDLAEYVARQAAEMGVRTVAIGGGEPLLWPHLRRFTELLMGTPVEVAITTNGTIYTQEFRDMIKNGNIRRINFSHDIMHGDPNGIYSNSKATDTQLTYANSLLHERTKLITKRLEDLKRWKPGQPVGINTVLTDVDLLDSMYEHILAPAMKHADSITLILPKPLPLIDDYWVKKVTDLIDHIRLNNPGKQIYMDGCLGKVFGKPCWQGCTSMAIDAAGRCSVCSNTPDKDKIPLHTTTMKGVWRSIAQSPYRGCIMIPKETRSD